MDAEDSEAKEDQSDATRQGQSMKREKTVATEKCRPTVCSDSIFRRDNPSGYSILFYSVTHAIPKVSVINANGCTPANVCFTVKIFGFERLRLSLLLCGKISSKKVTNKLKRWRKSTIGI